MMSIYQLKSSSNFYNIALLQLLKHCFNVMKLGALRPDREGRVYITFLVRVFISGLISLIVDRPVFQSNDLF